ncbi:MAG: glycosyltransferase, partial [Patescibacteria group bacterium]
MILSVIIPTIRGKELLKDSLPKLYEAIACVKIRKEQYEIVIIDNAQDPNTKAFVCDHFPNVVYIAPSHNLGFASSINIGIDVSTGQFILALNDDCLVEHTTIKQMIEFLRDHSEIYFTQPIIIEGEKPTIGYRVDLRIAKAFPIHKLEMWKQKQGQKSDDKPFKTHTIFGLSATCLLAKREVFAKIGKFDESFHSYLEDVEFCLCAALKGVVYFPTLTATATHLHMQTSNTMKLYKPLHDFINWMRIIAKHYPKIYVAQHFMPLGVERLRNAWGIVKQLFT